MRFAGPRLEKGGDELLPVAAARRRPRARRRAVVVDAATARRRSTTTACSPASHDPRRRARSTARCWPIRRALGADVKVWARLKDGTPLVTAPQARRRPDRAVPRHRQLRLVEPAAVGPVRRNAAPHRDARPGGARSAAGDATPRAAEPMPARRRRADVLPPLQVLDGFGVLRAPPPTAQADRGRQDRRRSRRRSSIRRATMVRQARPRALNVIDAQDRAASRCPALPAGAERRAYESETRAAAEAVAAAALALGAAVRSTSSPCCCCRRAAFAAPGAAAPAARAGRAGRRWSSALARARRRAARAARTPSPLPPTAAAVPPPPTHARPRDASAPSQATGKVTFGYVLTGDAATDETSRQRPRRPRHACSPRAPRSSRASRSASTSSPTRSPSFRSSTGRCCRTREPLPDADARQDRRLHEAGRHDHLRHPRLRPGHADGLQPAAATDGTPLQRLLGRLDMPRLEPVPEDARADQVVLSAAHVPRPLGRRPALGRGRSARDSDQRAGRRAASDGVSSIIVTSNDLAAAWALDDQRPAALSRSCPAARRSARWRSAPASTS